jgi:hypothetical protein
MVKWYVLRLNNLPTLQFLPSRSFVYSFACLIIEKHGSIYGNLRQLWLLFAKVLLLLLLLLAAR